MTRQHIHLIDPENDHTFSSCVVAGDYIFTSHIAGYFDAEGRLVEGVAAQTRQCFLHLAQILAAAGATLDDVVKMTVFLKDINDFAEMRDTYRDMFNQGYPARLTATTQFVDPRCRVMVEAIAYRPKAAPQRE